MTPANGHRGGGPVAFGLLLMVRVLGRINGLLEPYVTLVVDTSGDPIVARRALVDQAAAQLSAALRVPSDDVTIYLQGGAAINLAATTVRESTLRLCFASCATKSLASTSPFARLCG